MVKIRRTSQACAEPPDPAEIGDDDISTGSNDAVDPDVRSELSDVLSGEDAVLAASDILLQRLREHPSLASWAEHADHAALREECKRLLRRAFPDSEWPEVLVTFNLMEGDAAEGLVAAVLDALRRPLPLGEDPMCSALAVLGRAPDKRTGRFLEHLRTVALQPGPEVLDLEGSKDIMLPPQPVESELDPVSRPLLESEPRLMSGEESIGSADDGRLSREVSGAQSGEEDQVHPASNQESNASESEGQEAKGSAATSTAKRFQQVARRSSDLVVSKHGMKVPTSNCMMVEVPQINTDSFDVITLQPQTVRAIHTTWREFVELAGSKQAAGEIIYTRVFEGNPSLQKLFTTPKAVQGVRFASGIASLVAAVAKPVELKGAVEALAFAHIQMDITKDKVELFRDSLVQAMSTELQDRYIPEAQAGWLSLFNYVGGALVYIRNNHSERVKALLYSWSLANDTDKEDKSGRAGRPAGASMDSGESDEGSADAGEDHKDGQGGKKASNLSKWNLFRKRKRNSSHSNDDEGGSSDGENGKANKKSIMNTAVPQTYMEMFEWNVVVMGFAGSTWLRQVLTSFDTIIRNVVNSQRLTEECEVVALRITKMTNGQAVNLGQYRSCMLAALRSRLPKIWNQEYEVAWTWLWDNVERLLLQTMGKPIEWERSLTQHMGMLAAEAGKMNDVRGRIYDRFFELAPQGQDYFKQSNTRLHFIAQKIQEMTLEIFKDPWKSVEDISGLGLRHVGYGIPTELIPPFVTASVEVQAMMTDNEVALEGYKWSLNLIAKILVRTIQEGSTIVMKAINANSAGSLKKAISEAPRGKRTKWLLTVQVGTHRISPLSWALESGKLEAAGAVLKDLLTIRADRETYYFGVDDLFTRHPDIVKRLCHDAPELLFTLCEGLIWRSRHSKNGMRRVNYYVKHLIVNQDGKLSDALDALAKSKDQAIISHDVIVLVSDTLWKGVVRRQFVLSRLGFLMNLLIFMLSQTILPKSSGDAGTLRWLILVGRVINYVFSVLRLGRTHIQGVVQGYRNGQTKKMGRITLPKYLLDSKAALSLTLLMMLICMVTQEPMIWCLGASDWPTEECPRANDRVWLYALFSMVAMVILWILLIDMAVFSTALLAFVLVIKHVMREVGRFAVTLFFVLVTFASAISCLYQSESSEFKDLPSSMTCLFAVTVGLYEGDYRELEHDPFLLFGVLVFMSVSTILLINLLIAQLNSSYEFVYKDMMGFARLARSSLICDVLTTCPIDRWHRFVDGLKLDQKLEFDEGDLGLPGGIQVRESGHLNPVTIDHIKRYGGTCSQDMKWPKDSAQGNEEKLERVEMLLQRALKTVSGSVRTKMRTGRSLRRGDRSSSGSFGSSMGSLMSSGRSDAS